MSQATAPASVIPESESTSRVFGNRFLLVAVASLRVLQIQSGARPRVDSLSRRPSVLAVAEVLAGCVPYFVA